jgi:hypothetical protein
MTETVYAISFQFPDSERSARMHCKIYKRYVVALFFNSLLLSIIHALSFAKGLLGQIKVRHVSGNKGTM